MQRLQREKLRSLIQIQTIYFIFSRITTTRINTNFPYESNAKVINIYLTFNKSHYIRYNLL